jgi:hypothetical protein
MFEKLCPRDLQFDVLAFFRKNTLPRPVTKGGIETSRMSSKRFFNRVSSKSPCLPTPLNRLHGCDGAG